MKIGLKITDGFNDVVFADELSVGYEDITSVKHFIKWGEFEHRDYKWIRKRFQELDWDSLTDEEKIIVAQRRGTSIANCKTVLNDAYEFWMTDFDLKSRNCRQHRFSYAKTVLVKNVSTSDLYTILGAMGTVGVAYIDFGVEGTNDLDPIPGLFNFIESNGAFENTGIATMALTMTNSVTKEQMISKMMDCLRNGNY